MRRLQASPTYGNLMSILFNLHNQGRYQDVRHTEFNGANFKKIKTEYRTKRVNQPIVITDIKFLGECTNQERLVVMKIMLELKLFNCLWACDPEFKRSNSANRKAINSLLGRQILQETETPNIYVVNPFYIRRGDLWYVLSTTVHHLKNISKVSIHQIVDRQPVDFLTEGDEILPLLGYGYTEDNN